LEAKFEVRCLSYEGVEAIKRALKEGEKISKPNFEIKVNCRIYLFRRRRRRRKLFPLLQGPHNWFSAVRLHDDNAR
jgi:hypothetical protein